jgi:hypothetical protein
LSLSTRGPWLEVKGGAGVRRPCPARNVTGGEVRGEGEVPRGPSAPETARDRVGTARSGGAAETDGLRWRETAGTVLRWSGMAGK